MHINKLKEFIAAGLVALSSSAAAVPTLTFNGDLAFDSSGLLEITAQLTGSSGLSTTANLEPNSDTSLTLKAVLDDSSSFAGITTGTFGTASANPDISILDVNDQELLTGDIDSLLMIGGNGRPTGQLQGYFMPIAGSLLGDFADPSSVFAVVLELSTVAGDEVLFSSQMFTESFTGGISAGTITGTEVSFPPTAVPEPNLLVLLATGFFLMVGSRRRC